MCLTPRGSEASPSGRRDFKLLLHTIRAQNATEPARLLQLVVMPGLSTPWMALSYLHGGRRKILKSPRATVKMRDDLAKSASSRSARMNIPRIGYLLLVTVAVRAHNVSGPAFDALADGP